MPSAQRSQIADYLEWAESTVRKTIHRWNQNRLVGLWEAEGRGKKPSWTKEEGRLDSFRTMA